MLQDRFYSFEENPFEFCKNLVETLPQYSKNAERDRAKTLLVGAAQLDTNLDELLILERFVVVSAYKLFRRGIPTPESQVVKSSVKQSLIRVGFSMSDKDDVDK